jgi:hypothetical protein
MGKPRVDSDRTAPPATSQPCHHEARCGDSLGRSDFFCVGLFSRKMMSKRGQIVGRRSRMRVSAGFSCVVGGQMVSPDNGMMAEMKPEQACLTLAGAHCSEVTVALAFGILRARHLPPQPRCSARIVIIRAMRLAWPWPCAALPVMLCCIVI